MCNYYISKKQKNYKDEQNEIIVFDEKFSNIGSSYIWFNLI